MGLWLNRFRIWTLFCQSPRTALQYLLLCYYLLFKVLQSDLPNRLHVHLCVLVWITQREGIPAACPSSMASSAEPTEADVAAVTLSELFLDDDTQTQLMELARQQLRAEGKDEMAAEHALWPRPTRLSLERGFDEVGALGL